MANSELSSLRAGPWLVYANGQDSKFQTFHNICDPMNRSCTKYIPELSRKGFWQKPCHQGWLVILCYRSDYGDCFLWNPASLETIQLPNFQHCVEFQYDIKDCVLSSPPQTSTHDSIVYILLDGDKTPDILIYCQPGAKEWRKHEIVNHAHNPYRKILYFKDKLYIMCFKGHCEIEIRHGSDVGISYIASKISKGEVVAGSFGTYLVEHWVEYFGEVFCIQRYYAPRGVYQNCVTSIEIRKMDFSTLTWVKVKCLNDYVFFLSDRVQLCCLASELGLPKGCVYFTQDEEMSLYKYDLDDDSILLSFPCPNLPKTWLSPSWLMIPTTDHKFGNGNVNQVIIIKTTESKTGNTGTGEADEKEDFEETKLWTMLNEDLVWSVSTYLHTLDYIRLRAVSKHYRSILELKRKPSSITTPKQPTDISPWLVLSRCDKEVFNFINPMHTNENYLMNYPEYLKGCRIRFSKGGWLLMSKDDTLFFHNPFNRSTVKLPDLGELTSYYFSGISFSSAPTSSDCVVFAIDDFMSSCFDIFFIKKGDRWWRRQEFNHISLPPNMKHLEFEVSFNNPVFYHGAFYCISINGTLGVSKLENEKVSWDILTTVAPPNCDFIFDSFLVECGGKLLSVLLGHLGKWIRVFRLNDTEMVWEEVKNLGQHMLFLSKTSSISAIAPTGSQMENKIYFPRLHKEGILFYSLDTGIYHCTGSTHSAQDYRDSEERLHCSWIEPNWLKKADDRHLDWLSI